MATDIVERSQAIDERRAERSHRVRLWIAYFVAAALILTSLAYGLPYYKLPMIARVQSDLHNVLRPSGVFGLRVGQFGAALMVFVYLYGIRKRWPWLRSVGNTRHWLDYHILLGMTAPLLITLHSSFKFQGTAGVAFWIMWVVVMSGFVGRYFYGQIPRTLNAAELSLNEMEILRTDLTTRLVHQSTFRPQELGPLLRVPTREQVERMSLTGALGRMFLTDIIRPFRVSRLRRKCMTPMQVLWSIGGLLPSNAAELEEIITLARRQSWISTKMNFLGKAQKVFHLWHIVHRPFSYTLVALALLHIVTALLLGYY